MILLDTDHLTVLGFPGDSRFALLVAHMQASSEQSFKASVISLEEQARGWLAEINRERDVQKQIPAYNRLTTLFRFYGKWDILPFDERAAAEFARLRKQKVRIGPGSENHNLPAFVVMISQGSGNKTDQPLFSRLWGSGFLPTQHQGVRLRSGADPVLYLSNPPGVDADSRRRMLDGVAELNRLAEDVQVPGLRLPPHRRPR